MESIHIHIHRVTKDRAAPAEGEVGAEEFKAYGKYFKKGDTVKDPRGNIYEVLSHVGPVVVTYSGGSFHPTKLNHVA